jgi:hypothetical protein
MSILLASFSRIVRVVPSAFTENHGYAATADQFLHKLHALT